ncbi:MAG: helix-turn-helix domain-containing protein [Chloroflexota bacterium]|nr:helix-turn-helix domain-containing protein [Chloroflexota bacterium]
MSDSVPPASTAGSGTPAEPTVPAELGAAPVRYSVPEAARALGISERAVRKWIDAGTLEAEKDGRAWSVLLPTATGTARPAVPAAPVTVVAEPGTGTGPEPPAPPAAPAVLEAVPPSVDLAPLAALIERQAAEIQRLTEAATTWQIRAGVLEQQLKQLTAGDDTPTDAPQAVPEPQGEAQPVETAREPHPRGGLPGGAG